MKRLFSVTAGILAVCVSTSAATERAGRLGFGLRGGLFAPMLDGSNFTLRSNSYEPFMLGWGLGAEATYGLTNQIELMGTLVYARSYDDTLGTGDQSFKLLSADNASRLLKSYQLSLMGRYFFAPESKFQPYVMAGVGIEWSDYEDRVTGEAPGHSDAAVRGGLGFTYAFTEQLALDVRGLFSYDVKTTGLDVTSPIYNVPDWEDYGERPFRAHFQPSVGLTFSFGGAKDEDDDGVKDARDRCPMTPRGARVDRDGCPLDEDGDGVYDGFDLCVNTPAGARVDAGGCPMDTDRDGVYDGIDQCDQTPADAAVDAKGCPLDGDQDGVPDYQDQQLDTPPGAKIDENGVGLDEDRDGVYDGLDKCPGTPRDLEVDSAGCPLKVERLVGKITLNIKYAPNSFEPDAAAMRTLDSLVEMLRAYPDTRITISGYTDSQGTEAQNLELSRKRAEAVAAYVMNKGVDFERVRTVGFGEDPKYFKGDNATAEGRRLNRRVEIESAQ